LLFEGGGNTRVDVVIVVSAPADIQRARVLERAGMTVEKLESLLSRQMSDGEKRRGADFVVDTGGTIADSQAEIDRIVAQLKGRAGTALKEHWS
jgi:dephospho-CoA kinase